jgi:type II secretory ATPase GspE/PulE/Tfp pilus assembly ATPase PilB-like protein
MNNNDNDKISHNSENSRISVFTVKKETDLPLGKVLSAPGDEFKLTDSLRKEFLVWDTSSQDRKTVWLLAVKASYGSNNFLQLLKDIEKSDYKLVKKAIIEPNLLNQLYDKRANVDNQSANATDSTVVLYFEKILKDALLEKVSDIHFEVRPTGGIIRMRKNGDMLEYEPDRRLTYREANDICSVIYNVLASTKSVSFDPRDCQQAAVNYFIKGEGNKKDQELKLRYQSVPAYPDGYDVILRVLPIGNSEDFTPLQLLGYTEQQVVDLIDISSRPVGSLIIAGVTGSGKSTTMKNLLMYINANSGYRLKIYSIEDPPEYNIPKITQIPVVIGKDFDPTKMSPFEKPIKACMRGDPDIIMIGEVRDKITGDLTKKAIQSGHQVLTTVHATSAIGIIDRFQDFGLTRSVLGSPDFLTGLIYQKLMPIVCPHCSLDFHNHINSEAATKEDIDIYKRMTSVMPNLIKFPIKLRNKEGCSHCKGTGVVGRTVCAEVIKIDIEMMKYIEQGKTLDLLLYWRNLSDKKPESENMKGKTCMEHAFQKVLAGKICPFDLEASFKPINEMLLEDYSQIEDDEEEYKIATEWNNL